MSPISPASTRTRCQCRLASAELLPPILVNHGTPAAAANVRKFYLSVAELFERWVTRRESPNTQRAYRNDVMALLEFLAIDWPREGMKLFTVTVGDVQRWRDWMIAKDYAPKTINRRVSSVSSLIRTARPPRGSASGTPAYTAAAPHRTAHGAR